jgi:hypothetical protein
MQMRMLVGRGQGRGRWSFSLAKLHGTVFLGAEFGIFLRAFFELQHNRVSIKSRPLWFLRMMDHRKGFQRRKRKEKSRNEGVRRR